MIAALVAGRICGKPARRVAKNGSAFAVTKIRVGIRDGAALFISVICFSESAVQALLALSDGDSIALSGELTPKVWTDANGVAHPQIDMLCHAVLTPYAVKRRRDAVSGNSQGSRRGAGRDAEDDVPAAGVPAAGEPPAQIDAYDFDDDIPF